jgi:hypothetical protein
VKTQNIQNPQKGDMNELVPDPRKFAGGVSLWNLKNKPIKDLMGLDGLCLRQSG